MQPVDRQRRRQAPGGSLAGTNLERAGDYNQRVTLQAIRVNGPITRVDLARLTGLTTPAIANITNRLLSENLIVEVGRSADIGARLRTLASGRVLTSRHVVGPCRRGKNPYFERR